MTTSKDIPAFPQYVISNDGAHVDGGMTLRHYFAAKAMQALIQARTTLKEEEYPDDSYPFAASCGLNAETDVGKDGGGKYRWVELLVEEAYEVADEMVAQGDKND